MSSTMPRSCSGVSDLKTTTSSTRLRNSGRKCFLSSDITRLVISLSERPEAPWAEKPMVVV